VEDFVCDLEGLDQLWWLGREQVRLQWRIHEDIKRSDGTSLFDCSEIEPTRSSNRFGRRSRSGFALRHKDFARFLNDALILDDLAERAHIEGVILKPPASKARRTTVFHSPLMTLAF
jgi:hypothetical protein